MSKYAKGLVAVFLLVFICNACGSKLGLPSNNQSNVGGLKVMSYNIHHANPPGKLGLIDLDAIAEVIKKERPDVVGLQEVDRYTKRSGNVDEAKLLAEKTGMNFQFFKAIDHNGGDYGLAILSKFPMSKPITYALPQVTKGEPRILSYARIQLPNKTLITFANTHLDATRPDSNRVAQMKSLLSELSAKKEPVILVGDFNCEAKSAPIALLDEQFKRSCVTNCAFTIPQDLPRKTIDYIALRNANWEVISHKVVEESYASDHRPVVVYYQYK